MIRPSPRRAGNIVSDEREHRQRHRDDDVRDDVHTVASDEGGQWLPLGAAARLLGISRSSVYGRVRRGTLSARPLGNRGLEVLVSTVSHDVTGDDVSSDRDNDADDVAATLREELATARVTIGRLEERLAAAGEMRAAIEARAAAEAAALRATLTKAEERGDRLEAALREATRSWLDKLIGMMRRH
jgi:hypothetical protein